MFNVLDYAQEADRPDLAERGYKPYQVSPDVIYPATIARIQAVLESGELPQELVDPSPVDPHVAPAQGANLLVSEAKGVPSTGWRNALVARSQFSKKADIAARALALEVAQRWFTRALHIAVGEPLGLQILKDEDYSL